MAIFTAWESIGSSILVLNAKGHKTRPRVVDGLRPFFFYLYFNFTKRSITTMPTIFLGEVVDGVGVMQIFWCRGA